MGGAWRRRSCLSPEHRTGGGRRSGPGKGSAEQRIQDAIGSVVSARPCSALGMKENPRPGPVE